jgi:hypothetical protein
LQVSPPLSHTSPPFADFSSPEDPIISYCQRACAGAFFSHHYCNNSLALVERVSLRLEFSVIRWCLDFVHLLGWFSVEILFGVEISPKVTACCISFSQATMPGFSSWTRGFWFFF